MKNTKKKLNSYEWLMLARLMKNTADIKDSLEILYRMTKNERIRTIQEGLDQGKSFKTILQNNQNEKKIGYYTDFFRLDKAIEVVHQRNSQSKQFQQLMFKKLSYPILIFAFSIVVMSLFADYVLPTMVVAISSTKQIDGVASAFQILKITKDIFLILVSVFAIMVVGLLLQKKEGYLWLWLHRYNKDHFFKLIATYQFVLQLSVLLDESMNLMDCLTLIRYQKQQPLAAMLASKLHHSLLEGKQFEIIIQDELFDESFAPIVMFGLQRADLKKALEDYAQLMQQQFQAILQKVSLFIQGVCYLFVCIVIILAYQLLLMPLEMLNSF